MVASVWKADYFFWKSSEKHVNLGEKIPHTWTWAFSLSFATFWWNELIVHVWIFFRMIPLFFSSSHSSWLERWHVTDTEQSLMPFNVSRKWSRAMCVPLGSVYLYIYRSINTTRLARPSFAKYWPKEWHLLTTGYITLDIGRRRSCRFLLLISHISHLLLGPFRLTHTRFRG